MEFNLKKFSSVINIEKLALVQYFEFTNNFHSVPHSHNFYEMVFVDTESIKAVSEHFNGVINEGEMILHIPNEEHYLETDGKNAPNVIIIGFSVKCERLNNFCSQAVKLLPNEKKLLVEIIREVRNVYLPPYDIPYDIDMKKRDIFPFGADQLIKILLEEFLIKFIRFSEKIIESDNLIDEDDDPLVAEICQYIQNNITENLSLKTLTKLFCINKTSLCANFKKSMNLTISDFINLQRIKKAKILIREKNKTFTQISAILNFSSVHYFSKVFSIYEKMTPTKYIQTIKSKLEN